MEDVIKRLFFGLEVDAPWQLDEPEGRVPAKQQRHLTLIFFGNILVSSIKKEIPNLPLPHFKVGQCGVFDKCILLPDNHPKVVALHATFKSPHLGFFQQNLTKSLISKCLISGDRGWLPHVTVSRKPFVFENWIQIFSPFPFAATSLHLYESIGNLQYEPIWSFPILPPFYELDHTADIAFKISGDDIDALYYNAFIALCFNFPALLGFFIEGTVTTLDEIIHQLNRMITAADSEIGCCYKAVSYHGQIISENGVLQWEMIVDV